MPHAETKPYFYLGKHYVLADEMFASNFDASSFISHQYIIAGQASSAVNYPSDAYWGCPGGPCDLRSSTITHTAHTAPAFEACFDNHTLGDELDKAGSPWAFYTATINGDGGIWSAYQAIKPHLQRSRLEQRRHHAADAFLQRRRERQAAGR